MNMREPDNPRSQRENTVAERNVERLLTSAYQPETLDPEFVQRVHTRACAAAKEDRREATATSANTNAWRTTDLWLALVSTALAVALVVGYEVPHS